MKNPTDIIFVPWYTNNLIVIVEMRTLNQEPVVS